MTAQYQITDTPLPHAQDFRHLKEEGLAFIQKFMDYHWNNLNPSDPGVTILDQLCYALTELGYCNAFPVVDILTRADGKLQVKDQFYLPEEILTTAPATLDDYRRYCIDAADGLDNLVIIPCCSNISPLNRCYKAYLLIAPAIPVSSYADICKAVFYSLNKSRNIGEVFLMPEPLRKLNYLLEGTVEIDKEQDQYSVLQGIQEAISNYIFNAVQQTGYNQLLETGVEEDEIFDGPLLRNGWITSAELGSKKDQLQAFELAPVIESVRGVVSATVRQFKLILPGVPPLARTDITCSAGELIYIDILQSRRGQQPELTVHCNGKVLSFDAGRILSASTGKLPETGQKIVYGARPGAETDLPKGNYRDINSYYSIQNTFPESYGLSEGALMPGASTQQVALTRQLKAYLTLFDQVLANQFSQLANLGRLFSFRNSMTGAPADLYTFNAAKTPYKRAHQQYPVPYKVFSPTYFYQSLYSTPGIKPLLKDNDVFRYSFGPVSETELEIKSWNAYMQDPYNAYMFALMELMENESQNLERRNEMLDHLLARHGESPLVIDTITDGFIAAGNSLKVSVIFKSLYLQNLALLTYNRQKACNYQAADTIKTYSPGPPEAADDLPDGNLFRLLPPVTADLVYETLGENTIDFIFDSVRVSRMEKLYEKDFINYSALELKLSLLFGLRFRYKTYVRSMMARKEIIERFEIAFDAFADERIREDLEKLVEDIEERKSLPVIEQDVETTAAEVLEELAVNELAEAAAEQTELKIRLALWFSEMRRGLILIETNLLWKYLDFNLLLAQNADKGPFWRVEEIAVRGENGAEKSGHNPRLSYEKAALVNAFLAGRTQKELDQLAESSRHEFEAGGSTYCLVCQTRSGIPAADYQRLNNTGFFAGVALNGFTGEEMKNASKLLQVDVLLLFPQFVDTLKTPGFTDRLDVFMRNSLAVTENYRYDFLNVRALSRLVPAFVNWHEALRFHPGLQGDASADYAGIQDLRSRYAKELLAALMEFYNPANEGR